ncbi:histone-lysine N-methyltransferase 2A-like isoform X2 [Clavelina lepadiformis]|uniref:histone-lysine N-methyltransferase 2A-like isoform X2 n=1 Tax=Clavelina lepadiformis TaxID=159417 RepID=UPI00404375D6
MSATARGAFPGRPKKKIQKRKVKFQRCLHKHDLGDLKHTCSFIKHSSQHFKLIFNEENEQDIDFVGFSSEECGLRAYKRISKKVSSSSSRDILGSKTHYDKDKVTTRGSHARDASLSPSAKQHNCSSSPGSVLSNTSQSSQSSSFNYSRDADTSSSSDSAFIKYKDSKLDFHRLSKKAKNKDTYEQCSAEEQAKRKHTSVASLKYASEIYLAKNQSLQGIPKSPIKPATFIPPPRRKHLHVLPTGETSIKIRRGIKRKDEGQDQRKGAGHPEVLAKSLLARANRQNRKAESNNQEKKHKNNKVKGFTLPAKSVRSSRIIKVNRKYIDGDTLVYKESSDVDDKASVSSQSTDISQTTDASVGTTPPLSAKCSVSISRIPDLQNIVSSHKHKTSEKNTVVSKEKSYRRPLIKQPTFLNNNKACEEDIPAKPTRQQKGAHGRRLIKRARFKHPTSSDALVLGKDYAITSELANQKNLIREATFTPPSSKKGGKPSKCHKPGCRSLAQDFNLSPELWESLLKPLTEKWKVGDIEKSVPSWSNQEVHNLLHGVHNFGVAWSTVARRYEFHELHRDWLNVRQKALRCKQLGLLSHGYKVKSSVLLQLQPQLSTISNITVFTAQELHVRGLTSNIPCNFGVTQKRGRGQMPGKDKKFNQVDQTAASSKNIVVEQGAKSRIFGTQLTIQQCIPYQSIPGEELYLGVPEVKFQTMLQPRNTNTVPWKPWEIHNVLHGVHYFGVGAWSQISIMYRFRIGHNNLAIRARFRSVCYRGLIVAGDVRPDVLPKLYVVLSNEGKKYFSKHGIPVKLCSLSACQLSSFEHKENCELSRTKKGTQNKKHKYNARLKQPTLVDDSETDDGGKISNDSEDDEMTISPPRRQAYHLFGANPVWDEAAQMDLIELHSDSETTPVLQALEDGLRRNATSPENKNKTTKKKSSPTLLYSKNQIFSSKPGDVAENVTIGTSRNNKGIFLTKEKFSPPTKGKGKGPRIKHVCRRASLVTGLVKATKEDAFPHLTALPKTERERIAAEAEKLKENIPEFTSSDSEVEKISGKAICHTARKEKTTLRKRSVSNRCGACETCTAPPCQECDVCRDSKNLRNMSSMKSMVCLRQKPCLKPIVAEIPAQSKRNKRTLPEEQPASRKSSRLQQQKAPLRSAPTNDASTSGSNIQLPNPSTHSEQTILNRASSTTDSTAVLSPSSHYSVFDNLNEEFIRATIKIDNWKETYDLDMLWKSGGHALITSNPSPPRTVCLLCGSRGLAEKDSHALIYCASCCEPFHRYCADEHFERPNIAFAMNKGTWLCRRCQYCRVCGHSKNLLECRRCCRTYHKECLGPSYPTKPSSNKVWICMQCVRCKSCGTSKPGSLPGSVWTHDYTMCERCGGLYDKGNFCPICQKCYNDEDYDTRMIQCAKCKRWIHSKCENLSVEMYTLLSHLPDSVQYKCPDCDGRAKQLEELGRKEESENTAANTASKPPGAEKIREMLSHLPSPFWRKTMQKDVQSGLEAVVMALFHNRATYCVLKKNEGKTEALHESDVAMDEDDQSKPHDLFTVRFAVHNKRYQSVSSFWSDVHRIISSVLDVANRAALEKAFKEEAGSVFPWFNFETGRVRDVHDIPEDLLPNATLPPSSEHNYAQWQDKDILVEPGTPNPSPMKSLTCSTPSTVSTLDSPLKSAEDLRQCSFCGKYGDHKSTECGRLLFCGQDEWCHVNCALWSAEVYEQHDGSLANVHSAVSRGKMLKCDFCRLPGATVGCNTRDCPKNYHFMCARSADCYFQDDKKVFCVRHHNHTNKEILGNEDFDVERLVCVDNDEMRPNRRWQRGMLISNITITIGALTVHQLGRIGAASDSKHCLIPRGFRMTRVFWSTTSSSKKTVYTITVTEKKPSMEGDMTDIIDPHDQSNMTISHNDDNFHTLPQKMDEKSHQSRKSLPCRKRLIETLDDNATVSVTQAGLATPGPLVSAVTSRQSTGTYTLMSSLNTSLPQAVTPLTSTTLSLTSSPPKCAEVVTSNSTNSNFSPTVAIRNNPFLNGPCITSNVIIPVASNVDTKSTDSKLIQSSWFTPCAQSSKIGFGAKTSLTDVKPPSSQAVGLCPGMSGTFLQFGGKMNEKDFTQLTSNDVAPEVSLNVSGEKKEVCSPQTVVENVKDGVKPDTKQLAMKANTRFDNEKVISNELSALQQDMQVDAIKAALPTSTVSLLVEAKMAAEVERQDLPQEKCMKHVPSLWWKKSNDHEVGKIHFIKSLSGDERVTPKRRPRLRSADNDPTFQLKHSEAPYWKRKNQLLPRFVSKRSPETKHRSCKDPAMNYNEIAANNDGDLEKKFNKCDPSDGGSELKSHPANFNIENNPTDKLVIKQISPTKVITRLIDTKSERIEPNEDNVENNLNSVHEFNSSSGQCCDTIDDKSSSNLMPSETEGSSMLEQSKRKTKVNTKTVKKKENSPDCHFVDNEPSINLPLQSLSSTSSFENNMDSDEENDGISSSPKRNLRKFALKSSDDDAGDLGTREARQRIQSGKRHSLTRQRSKSQDPNFTMATKTRNSTDANIVARGDTDGKMSDSYPGPPSSSTRARHRSFGSTSSSPQDQVPASFSLSSDIDSPRRYPRRNTYTCLKSFSGLSPNYALASYSRTDRKLPKVDRKQNARKQKKSRSESIFQDKRKRSNKHDSLKVSLTLLSENSVVSLIGVDDFSETDKMQQKSPIYFNEMPVDNETLDVKSSTSCKKSESNVEKASERSVGNSIDERVNEHTTVASTEIITNIITTPESDEILEKSSASLSDGTDENINIVKSVLGTVLNNVEKAFACLDTNTELNWRQDATELTLDDEQSFLNESLEVVRGGGDDIMQFTAMDTALSPVPTSPDQLAIHQTKISTEDSILLSHPNLSAPKNMSSTVGCDKDMLNENSFFVPEVSPSRSINIDESLVQNPNNSLFASECPVLNVDEVQTLLENPEPPLAQPVLNTPQLQPVAFSNDVAVRVQMPLVVSPQVNLINQAMPQHTVLPIHTQTVAMRDIGLSAMPIGRAAIPRINSLNRPSQHQFYSGAQITTGVRYQSPTTPFIVQKGGVMPPHAVAAPSRNMVISGHLASSHNIIPHNPTGAVPYSMRVTMAMAGAINCQPLSTQAFSPLLVPSQQQKVSSFCEKRPHTCNENTIPKQFSPGAGYINSTYPKVSIQDDESCQKSLQRQDNLNPPAQSPQSTSSKEDALENLIEFYSAKNNLTPEEKAIVRSIIKSQIKNNQMPSPSKCDTPPTIKQESNNIRKDSAKGNNNSSVNSSQRIPSQHEGIHQQERKKKSSVTLQESNAEYFENAHKTNNDLSCLAEIYAKRRNCYKHGSRPLTKVLSSYNIFLGDKHGTGKENKLPPPPKVSLQGMRSRPHLVYEIKSDDGYYTKGTDLQELVNQLLTSVQECRATAKGFNPTIALHSVMTPHAFLGVSHDAVRFLVEQLPAAKYCHRYRAKYHKHKKAKEEITHINPHGCCRAEQYKGRSKPDMFSFLASKHRYPPEFQPDKHQDDDMLQLSNRRVTSMEDLPMAMRFRHLRTFSKEAVGVYRSSIHGRGLYCKRDLEAGEMIMEYTGQMIRKDLTDKREKHYESKSIGCYMFRMDDLYVVDATILGSAARFINHSCEPSCYSRIVHVDGKKHIVIFALRKIYRGEELTYDYKFPIEDETHKITCNCGARSCRKYLN